MRVRQSIFGSLLEQEAFTRIRRRLSGKIDVYPSLPLASLLEADDDELAAADQHTLFRLNVDYTICEPSGVPIFSVEFDGIGGGITRPDGRYEQRRNRHRYPTREADMNFKLSLARRAGYPLIVITEKEVDPWDEGGAVTVLDGIVGSVLAARAFNAGYDDALATVKLYVERPTIEDYVDALDDLSVETQSESHPLGLAWLNAPVGCLLRPWEEKRVGDRFGCTARVGLPPDWDWKRDIRRTVWVRDFYSAGLPVDAQSIATEIALYLATEQAHRQLEDALP